VLFNNEFVDKYGSILAILVIVILTLNVVFLVIARNRVKRELRIVLEKNRTTKPTVHYNLSAVAVVGAVDQESMLEKNQTFLTPEKEAQKQLGDLLASGPYFYNDISGQQECFWCRAVRYGFHTPTCQYRVAFEYLKTLKPTKEIK
jgi:hypothetical protein